MAPWDPVHAWCEEAFGMETPPKLRARNFTAPIGVPGRSDTCVRMSQLATTAWVACRATLGTRTPDLSFTKAPLYQLS